MTPKNMADELVNFDSSEVFFCKYSDFSQHTDQSSIASLTYNIGQLIYMHVKCKTSENVQKTLKTAPAGRSPLLLNLAASVKRQLSANVEVKCSIKQVKSLNNDDNKNLGTGWHCCKIQRTLNSSSKSEDQEYLKREADLSADRKFYIIPMCIRIPELSDSCHAVCLQVHVRPPSKHAPKWLSSPTRPEFDILDEQDIEQKTGKKVYQKLNIIHPPSVMFQQKSAGNAQMICLSVKNTSSHPVTLCDCSILPDACPKAASKTTCCEFESILNKRVCAIHGEMVHLLSDNIFPVELLPGEQQSVCATMNMKLLSEAYLKEDIVFEAHLMWSRSDNSSSSNKKTPSTMTVYRLPALRLRKGLFVLSAKTDVVPVKKGQCFTVKYTVNNFLQEFLSIKLNWMPCCTAQNEFTENNILHLEEGLICQDPCVQLGACQYGETIHAEVGFMAVKTGVYEVCKHMKVNLRYLIPGSDNTSLASPTSITSGVSDDLLLLNAAFEDLWRPRSGSRSSYNEPGSTLLDPKTCGAFKSHSFGDLHSEKTNDLFKTPSTSTARRSPLPTRREVKNRSGLTAAQYEQQLLRPGNFIKNSCIVKVVAK